MPKRIVLVEPRYSNFTFDYLPQGLLSLAAYLRKAGFDVSVHDSLPLPQADVLGISCTTPQYTEALNIGRKAFAGTLVIGGAHVTTAPGDAMSGCVFDYGVVGDGEEAFVRLCEGDRPREIPGVVYREGGVIMASRNVPFKFKSRDGGIVLPAYDLFDGRVGKYVNIYRNREWDWGYGWVKSNRPKYWGLFSKEISLLKSLGVEAVHVADENFGCWHQNIKSTVGALDRLDWWTCRSGVRNFLDGGLQRVLFGSRCRGIEIAITTASKRLAREFCDHTVEEAGRAIALAGEIGLDVTVCALLGLPGETADSMVDTWNWLRGKKARLETLSPFPGTVYYDEPDCFSQFGYEVTARELREIGRDGNILPWRMNTISYSEFMDVRGRMQKELGG